MPLRDWFNESNGSYTLLELKSEDLSRFIDFFPSKFRLCYISDEEIQRACNNDQAQTLDAKTVVTSCLPDPGRVMAGDFGEMACYFLLQERYLPAELDGALKWRWKEDRNRPMQKTDVVLFKLHDRPSPEDLIVAAETKTKSFRRGNYDPIADAIEGAEKDSVSRLAKTLSWLRHKYIRCGDTTSANKLLRFINSQEEQFGPYKKHHKAVVFIDSGLLQEELIPTRVMPAIENFEILVLGIPNLKETYEAIFTKIPNHA